LSLRQSHRRALGTLAFRAGPLPTLFPTPPIPALQLEPTARGSKRSTSLPDILRTRLRSTTQPSPQFSQLDSSGCPVDSQGNRLFEVKRGRPNWSAPSEQHTRHLSHPSSSTRVTLPPNPGPIRVKVEPDSSDIDKDSVERLLSRSPTPSSESSVTPSTIPSTPLPAPIPPFIPIPTSTFAFPKPPTTPLKTPTPPMSTRHLPFRTESGAPKWDGQPENLGQFFADVQRVCDVCIASPSVSDYINQTFNYLNNEQSLILEQCKPAAQATTTWETFKDDVWALYPEFRRDQRYTIPMVESLVSAFSLIESPTIEEWGAFIRNFTVMTTKLVTGGHLSDLDKTRYLQRALHERFWQSVFGRLQSVHPNHDPTLPFSFNEVSAAILWLVRWNAGAAGNRHPPLPPPVFAPGYPNPQPPAFAPGHLAPRPPPPNDTSIQLLPYRPPPLLTAPPPNPPLPVIKAEPTDHVFTTDEISRLRHILNTRQEQRADTFPRGCIFCGDHGHFIRECPASTEYISAGRCRRNAMGQIIMGDGSPIPNGTGTMQERIDRHATIVTSGFCGLADGLDFETFHTSTSSHDSQTPMEDWDPLVFRNWVDDVIAREGVAEVLATLRGGKVVDKPKGRENEKSTRFNTSPTGPTPSSSRISAPQQEPQRSTLPSNEPAYRYQSPIGSRFDPAKMADQLLNASITVSIGDVLAASPDLQKAVGEQLRRKRVPFDGSKTSTFTTFEISDPVLFHDTGHILGEDGFPISREALALRVVRPQWENSEQVFDCILDSGSQINVIRKDICDALGLSVVPGERVTMESADGRKSKTLGMVHNAVMCFQGIRLPIKAQVMKNAPYQILLGQPFLALTSLHAQHYPNGTVEVKIMDPRSGKELIIPTFPRGRSRPVTQGF
jgi:hypothetical protein